MSVPSIYMVAGHVLGGVASIIATASSSSWLLPSTHVVGSNLSLEMIAPQPSLTTTNAYYKHYTGMQFRRPIIAIGGTYPYQYTLSGAPSGMTVGQNYGNTDYGVINWPTPVAGSYTITATVTDQTLATVSTTWTLTIGTTGFVFVDSVNGNDSNNGTTITTPLQSFNKLYSGVAGVGGSNAARKADSTYQNDFVILRAGTYTTAQVNFEAGNSGQRAPMTNGVKPKVWIGYPGETAILDTTGSYIEYYNENSVGLWFSNITAAGMESTGGYKWVAFQGPMSNFGFFELIFSTPTATGGSGTNPDMLFATANAPNLASMGFIKSCIFNNTLNHELFEMYCTSTWAIHDNTLAGVNDGSGFYAKGDATHPTTGGNDTISVRGNAGLQANTARDLVELDNYAYATNVEICYNNYKSSGAGIYYGPDGGGGGISGIASFRNTWQVSEQTVDGVPVSTVATTNDVVVYSSGSANSHGYQVINSGSLSSGTYSGEECVGLNIAAVTAATGNLTGTFRTNYLGLRGHEVA